MGKAGTGKEVRQLKHSTGRRLVALVLVVLVTAVFGGSAWAAPVPSQSSAGAPEKADAEAIAAERELIKGKLMDFGLTEEEAASRVDLLADQEVHVIAGDLESLQVGGDEFEWNTVTVLLLLILVVLIVD
jgi:hypothetical protein